MYHGFPYAFNDTAIIDEATKIVDTWSYEEVTRNFSEYVNGLMYLSQAMLDLRTKVDHRKDFQDLQCLHEKYHAQQDSLIKEQKERKALEDYKEKYDSARESLCHDKQRLHEAAGQYIAEKNNFENHTSSPWRLSSPIANRNSRTSNSATVNCLTRMIQE